MLVGKDTEAGKDRGKGFRLPPAPYASGDGKKAWRSIGANPA